MILLFLILLSTILFNGAFFLPENLAFGALVGIVIVWIVVVKSAESCLSYNRFILDNFLRGLLWGGIVFLMQSIWVLDLVITFSHISKITIICFYLMIVFYCAITSGLWFSAMAAFVSFFKLNVARYIFCFVITVLYFLWFLNRGMIILFSGDGYPLFNPLIPLCVYRWFIKLICFVSSLIIGPNYFEMQLKNVPSMTFISPSKSKNGVLSKDVMHQKIYHQISDVDNKIELICGPESFFPHAISFDNLKEYRLWSSGLSPKQKCIFGAYVEEGARLYQAAIFFDNGPIMKNYVKKHLVPFIEHIPNFWKRFGFKGSILGSSDRCFSYKKNKKSDKIFYISSDLAIIPRICSEFIWSHSVNCYRKKINKSSVPVILWLVDDHRFSQYFRNVLQLAGRLVAAWIGLPIFYVGHHYDEKNNTSGWRL